MEFFSRIISRSFRYQLFVRVSGNVGGKVPVVDIAFSSHKQKAYSTNSLDEDGIVFDFRKNWNRHD